MTEESFLINYVNINIRWIINPVIANNNALNFSYTYV